MIRIALAATLALIATPALAHERAHNPQQVSDALKAGCTVQAVHTPAGKTVHQSAIVHCKQTRSLETASNRQSPREQRKIGVD